MAAAAAQTAEARLAAATAERRLRRTREGGREVAAAAHDMHDTVCDLREWAGAAFVSMIRASTGGSLMLKTGS